MYIVTGINSFLNPNLTRFCVDPGEINPELYNVQLFNLPLTCSKNELAGTDFLQFWTVAAGHDFI